MLLKAHYEPNEPQPHSAILHHICTFDAEDNVLLRIQELDTETMVGKLPDGSAVNVDHIGWFPPSQATYDELIQHLPRLYHRLVQLTIPEPVQCAPSP